MRTRNSTSWQLDIILRCHRFAYMASHKHWLDPYEVKKTAQSVQVCGRSIPNNMIVGPNKLLKKTQGGHHSIPRGGGGRWWEFLSRMNYLFEPRPTCLYRTVATKWFILKILHPPPLEIKWCPLLTLSIYFCLLRAAGSFDVSEPTMRSIYVDNWAKVIETTHMH